MYSLCCVVVFKCLNAHLVPLLGSTIIMFTIWLYINHIPWTLTIIHGVHYVNHIHYDNCVIYKPAYKRSKL